MSRLGLPIVTATRYFGIEWLTVFLVVLIQNSYQIKSVVGFLLSPPNSPLTYSAAIDLRCRPKNCISLQPAFDRKHLTSIMDMLYDPASAPVQRQSRSLHALSVSSTSKESEEDEESSPSSLLEVEQKFQLGSNIEQRLQELKFQPKRTIRFVDWYYDTNDVQLSIRDVWVRYRGLVEPDSHDDGNTADSGNSSPKGSWQIKIGKNVPNSETTVYEELEGIDALTKAKSILSSISTIQDGEAVCDGANMFDGHETPKFSDSIVDSDSHTETLQSLASLLKPFSRIVTTRSSWVYDSDGNDDDGNEGENYHGMSVDLDETNTGYGIGEVESVVATASDIPVAKQRIQSLIDQITAPPTTDNREHEEEEVSKRPPLGKLEHFLFNERPAHYKACIESGSMKRKH